MGKKLIFYLIVFVSGIFDLLISILNHKIISDEKIFSDIQRNNTYYNNTNNINNSDISNSSLINNINITNKENDKDNSSSSLINITNITNNNKDISNSSKIQNTTNPNSDTDKNKILYDFDLLNEDEDNNITTSNNITNMNIIPIAIGIDSKYIFQAVVFLTSLLENKKKSTLYNVYIMTADDIKDEHRNILNKLMNKYGKII